MDDSPSPESLITYLDKAAHGLTAMKNYVAAAARRAVGEGVVLDIGCGAGHDLELLYRAGLEPVGVDPSRRMLAAATERLSRGASPRLVQAGGERLPFRTASLAGCRLERVLIHVPSPDDVIGEVARVVRADGFLAVFEPDWGSLDLGGMPEDREVAGVSGSAGFRSRGRGGLRGW